MASEDKRGAWADQVNVTKLSPPKVSTDQVKRKRFINKINKLSHTPFILVRAPAGYGKSSTIAQWRSKMQRAGADVAWLNIDTLDNNIKRFLVHFVASLRCYDSRFGVFVQGQLRAPGRLSIAAVAGTIIQEISRISQPVYIVLDDFHLINNPDIIRLFELLMSNPPSNLTLVMLSRMALPLPTSRLAVKGQYVEFDANELRFSHAEVGEFIALSNDIKLSEETIEALASKTEGWIASIKLTALSIKDPKDADELVASFSGSSSDITRFLAEEVLSNLSAKTRQFLLETCILDRMCPDVCNRIVKSTDSQQILAELEQSGYFVIALDRECNWYRYHHLFAEFLQKKLKMEIPGKDKELCAEASLWFAENNMVDEAIGYSLRADDIDVGAELLDNASCNMFYHGQLSSLVHWVEKIGDKNLQAYPFLLLNYAWVLILEWQFLYAAKILSQVEHILNEKKLHIENSEEINKLEFILKHRRMMFCEFSDDTEGLKLIAEPLMAEGAIDDVYLSGNIYTSLMFCKREFLDISHFDEYSHKACEYYAVSGSEFVLVWHGSHAGPTVYMGGDTTAAERVLTQSLAYAAKINGDISALAAMPGLLLAEVLFEKNEIDRSTKLLDSYLPLSEQIGFVDQIIAGLVTRSKILSKECRFAEAKSVLHDGMQVAKAYNFDRMKIALFAELVRLACLEGDKKSAKKYALHIVGIITNENLKPKKNSRTNHVIAALAWCRSLRLNGEYNEAISLLKLWSRFLLQRNLYRDYVKFTAALAATHAAQGEQRVAKRLMNGVLERPECSKLINSFFEDGLLVERVLKSMLCHADTVNTPALEQAKFVLEAIGSLDKRQDNKVQQLEVEDTVEALGKLELTILTLVDEMHSNKLIADQLNLTEGTVKWYMQCIYNKLGVRKRAKAVKVAKDLGLLGVG